jgi:glycosyltransferase involved in cell wall biosynthesis
VKILLVGEEHIRAKVARHYAMLEERHGFLTTYFVDDRSGITRQLQGDTPIRCVYAPVPGRSVRSVTAYLRAFIRCFNQVRPDVLEVYTSMNPAVTLFMMLYAAARGVPRALVSRGEMYPAEMDRSSALARRLLVQMFRNANLVVYKELYMEEVLRRIAPVTPGMEWRNAIPVGPEPSYQRDGSDVLFLNLFKAWRNLDLIVDAAAIVRHRVPSVRFHLVGGAGDLAGAGAFYAELSRSESELRTRVARHQLEDVVEIHPFTTDVAPWFDRASVYLLPADLVFCNYSLLEAMERGVPPIVSSEKDADARLIVEDGVSGLDVGLDAVSLANAIVRMLTDEELRLRLARGARQKVLQSYDLRHKLGVLAEAYSKLAAGRGNYIRSARAVG